MMRRRINVIKEQKCEFVNRVKGLKIVKVKSGKTVCECKIENEIYESGKR